MIDLRQGIVGKLKKIVIFCTLGILIFEGIQNVIIQKWWYGASVETQFEQFTEFHQVPDDIDIQVLFLGTSHSMYAVNPMEIYKINGITSFNLSSTVQPLPVSYFNCAEMFRKYRPQVVMLDVSCLFKHEFWDHTYRIPLDLGANSKNKLILALEYASHFPSEKQIGAFISAFFPIYRYHDRWSELKSFDFEQSVAQNYYRKGNCITSRTMACSYDLLDWYNQEAELLIENIGWYHNFVDGIYSEATDLSVAYMTAIDETSLSYLLKIKQLCEENNAKLTLFKIPSVGDPQYYSGAWTQLRSNAVKEMAAEYGLEFYDLLYDYDVGIDWSKDYLDGGYHLNIEGARKISHFVADYLENTCGLAGTYCKIYEEDISIYEAICNLCELQMTNDLTTYLTRLQQCNNVTVFISVKEDMMQNLSEENQHALNHFGLQTQFASLSYSDALAVVKEADTIRYESSSNREISCNGILSNGSAYSITSAGWLIGGRSQIIIDGRDYTTNHRGINIVVLDNSSGLVLDSVAFDTYDIPERQEAIRNNSEIEKFLREYEKYLMIQDADNGIGV